MMNKSSALFLAITASSLSFSSQAALLTGWGVDTGASTASNCPSYCTSAGGGDFQYDSSGDQFSVTASSMEDSYGHGQSYAAISSDSYLPLLKVKASSDVGRGASASAFGVQGYTYTGTSSTTVTLDLNLHGSVNNNASGYAHNQLRADVAVLLGGDLEWYPSFATLIYEVAFDHERVGMESMFISSGNDVNRSSIINFDLNPGDEFYIVAQMSANSKNGSADAWNTLSMSFNDDSNLEAASVSAIPVPAAAWLFGSGLIGVMGAARRKSS